MPPLLLRRLRFPRTPGVPSSQILCLSVSLPSSELRSPAQALSSSVCVSFVRVIQLYPGVLSTLLVAAPCMSVLNFVSAAAFALLLVVLDQPQLRIVYYCHIYVA